MTLQFFSVGKEGIFIQTLLKYCCLKHVSSFLPIKRVHKSQDKIQIKVHLSGKSSKIQAFCSSMKINVEAMVMLMGMDATAHSCVFRACGWSSTAFETGEDPHGV